MKPKRIEEKHQYGQYHQVEEYAYKGNLIKRINYKDRYHGDRWSALFEYDNDKKLAAVKYPDGYYTFKYDAKNRLVEEKLVSKSARNSSFNKSLIGGESTSNTFEYNNLDQIIKRTEKYIGYGREREYVFAYSYDELGRVKMVENFTDNLVFSYEYGSSMHPLAGISIPICFLTNYITFKSLPSKITPNNGSPFSNKVISENVDRFPTEIEQIDFNRFLMNIKITY